MKDEYLSDSERETGCIKNLFLTGGVTVRMLLIFKLLHILTNAPNHGEMPIGREETGDFPSVSRGDSL
jgi:hypothetical protein